MSSSDAKYMAANFRGREAMWLKQLLTELGYHLPQITLWCDSQPAIAVSKNPEHHTRMKHIDVMYYTPCNTTLELRSLLLPDPSSFQVIAYPFYPQTLIPFLELHMPDPPRPSPFRAHSQLP